MVKKHIKPNSKNPQGGIEEKESPIHISNVCLINNNSINENPKKQKKSKVLNSKKKA